MTQAAAALSLGGITFLLTVIWGGPFIRVLRQLKIGKQIRIEGPQRHFTKLGTPTMGGWLFVIAVLLITGVLNLVSIISELNVLGQSVLLPLAVMLAFAVLGAVDDWMGVRGGADGLRGRWKFLIQTVLAVAAALALKYLLDATAFAAYGAIALLQGQTVLVRFCFTVVGAVFAFLWFNAHPAELFMGDTGALSLGATLAVVALMTGQWALLPIIAIIPFAVTVSVILQVVYFRRTKGKRLFKMAPLHNHFELSGWSETQIVQRFWLVGLLAAGIGIALALI